MTGMIKAEVETRYDIISTAQDTINDAIDTIQTQSSSVEGAIQDGRDTVQGFSDTFQDALRSINDFGSIVIRNFLKIFSYLFYRENQLLQVLVQD